MPLIAALTSEAGRSLGLEAQLIYRASYRTQDSTEKPPSQRGRRSELSKLGRRSELSKLER